MTCAMITGITGMVGSHLADYLLAHTGWEIYGMCRWRSPQDNVRHLLRRAEKKDRLHFIYGDLKDSFSLQKALTEAKPDYVFHLAAQSYPRTSFDAPLDTLDTNILGTARLLEAIRACGLNPIIHVCSSSEVYGRVSACLLYTSPSPRDRTRPRMPSSACKKKHTTPSSHLPDPTTITQRFS